MIAVTSRGFPYDASGLNYFNPRIKALELDAGICCSERQSGLVCFYFGCFAKRQLPCSVFLCPDTPVQTLQPERPTGFSAMFSHLPCLGV